MQIIIDGESRIRFFAKVAGIPGIPGSRECRTMERTYYSDTHCLQTSLFDI